MNGKVRKIVFLDSICDCRVDDALYIALRPQVYSYLKEKGFNVVSTRPYFTTESHKKVLSRSAGMVRWIEENADFIDFDMGTKDAFKNSLIFYSRFAFHYCLWVIEVVMNAIARHDPEILASNTSTKRYTADSYIQPEEGYMGRLVQRIAGQRGLSYEHLPANTSLDGKELVLKYRSIAKFILKSIDFDFWETGLYRKARLSCKGPVIFTTERYRMDKLIERLRLKTRNRQFHVLKGPIIADFGAPDWMISLLWQGETRGIIEQKKKLKEFIDKAGRNAALFEHEGIVFSDVIREKSIDSTIPRIVGEMLCASRLDKFLDRIRPSLIVSNSNRRDDMLLAELCRAKHIKTILISHGSIIAPKDEYEKIEWMEHQRNFSRIPFTAYALQTPLMENYFREAPNNGILIKTGPLIWGTPVKRKKNDMLLQKIFVNGMAGSKVVVHAGTPKPTFTRPYVYETSDEYLDALRDLADAVNKMDGTVLIIRFRPIKEISERDLRNRVEFSEKVKLSMSESFDEVLGSSDLLVSFSSTAIEEALQNRIPVLQYGGAGRYQHVPGLEIGRGAPISKSAVYHVREEGDLQYALQGILSLDIGGDKDAQLFAPYIYKSTDCIAFEDVVNEYSK